MNGDNDPEKVRIREAREVAVQTLSEAFARDEIGLDAFDARIEQVYRAGSVTEIERTTEGLAAPQAGTVVEGTFETANTTALATVDPARGTRMLASAVLGSVERTGPIALAGSLRARALLGSLVLDLRDVRLGPGVTEIRLDATLGSIEVFVPADVSVEFDGHAILGSAEGHSRVLPDADASTPVLRIAGRAVLGSIEVFARAPQNLLRHVERLRARRALPSPRE